MCEKRLLRLLLLLYLLLGAVYALTTPIFEASDELWHYPLVRHLAQGNPLPVQDPQNVGPWKQEASQPPLYYYLGAALTFWIDTSDMPAVRWLNPHVDNGVITGDGNSNLAIHAPTFSRWRGSLLAVTLIRLVSVGLGGLTVALTFRIGKEALPGRPEVALGAAALTAFMPMFLFISGAVNNDNLAIPLTSLGVLLMARLVGRARAGEGVGNRPVLVLGLVSGLAALTKQGTLALFPLALGSLFLAHWLEGGGDLSWRAVGRLLGRTAWRYLLLAVPALLVAGWWYARNLRLYGDLLGWSAFFEVLGVRAHPASLAQLWDERWGFLLSYWGLFGGVNVPMATWVYHVLNGVLVAGVAGFTLAAWQMGRQDGPVAWAAAGSQPGPVRRLLAAALWLVAGRFALVLSLLLSLAVVAGLVRWATTTWSSQGRLVFTALSGLNVLLAVGLAGWLRPRAARLVLAAVAGFLLLVALLAPFLWIMPAYRVPATPSPAGLQTISYDFGGEMRLTGYALDPPQAQPGDTVEVRLSWQALRPMDRDWSVFVHLDDPVLGLPVAQRDMYPGQGLLPTSLMQPGQVVVDRYLLHLPATAIAPATLRLTAGLYDFATGQRLPLAGGGDTARLDSVALLARPGELPNALEVNFENALTLAGFRLEPRLAQPGETLTLTLYWRAQRPLDKDYTFFAQVLGAENRRWAAMDLPQPTTAWTAGEVQELVLPLVLDVAVPAGSYPLIIGVYSRPPGGGFDRLQQVTPDGRLTDDFLRLTLVRVEG